MSAQRIRWTTEAATAGRPPLSIGGGVARLEPDFDAPAPAVLLRRARPSDAAALHALLDGYAREGLLLPRTREQIAGRIGEFTVAVDTHGLAGCGALRLYTPRLAELVALAVAPRLHGQGIGGLIVESIVEEAQRLGVRRLFALTLREAFFNRLGFRTKPMAEMPEKLAADCASCPRRNACNEILVLRALPAAL